MLYVRGRRLGENANTMIGEAINVCGVVTMYCITLVSCISNMVLFSNYLIRGQANVG